MALCLAVKQVEESLVPQLLRRVAQQLAGLVVHYKDLPRVRVDGEYRLVRVDHLRGVQIGGGMLKELASIMFSMPDEFWRL